LIRTVETVVLVEAVALVEVAVDGDLVQQAVAFQ
jgi:hypothetical protein